jgi:hypothetical protein
MLGASFFAPARDVVRPEGGRGGLRPVVGRGAFSELC